MYGYLKHLRLMARSKYLTALSTHLARIIQLNLKSKTATRKNRLSQGIGILSLNSSQQNLHGSGEAALNKIPH